MSNARPAALPALTGLRFFAAIFVLLFHVSLALQPRLPSPRALSLAFGPLVANGYAGVTIFFVLSGFILAYSYFGSQASTGEFLWARVARIVPVYLLSLALALPLFLAAHGHHHHTLLLGGAGTLAMVQAWLPQYAAVFNSPGWSLSNEAAFYLAFPVLLALLRPQPTRRLFATAGALWLTGLVAPIAYVALRPDHLGAAATPLAGSWWLDAVKFWPPLHFPSFAMGATLGVIVRRRGLPSAEWGAPAALVAVGVLWAVLASGRLPYPILHTVGLAPVALLLIAGLASGEGVLARACAHPAIVRLGEASYALYLVHMPILDHMVRSAARLGADVHSPWFAATFVGVALAASLLVHRTVEEPARRWLRARRPGSRRALLEAA